MYGIFKRCLALGVVVTVMIGIAVLPSITQHARNIYAAMVDLTAQSVTYVRGTRSFTPETSPSDGIWQLKYVLDGKYTSPDYDVTAVEYPAVIGVLYYQICGLECPSGDESFGQGTDNLITYLASPEAAGKGHMTVIGLSQGASATSNAIIRLRDEGFDTSDMEFVLIGNPNRPNGGFIARFPVQIRIPVLGLTVGTPATPSDGAKVTIITTQFDGFADFPAYPLNLLAVANAVMGLLTGKHEYRYDPANNSSAIVTTSGNLTSVFVPNKVGDLPILEPLRGQIPEKYRLVLDTVLRPIIMAGYEPNDDPAVNVTFKLLPSPQKFVADATAIAQGFHDGGVQLHAAIKEDIAQTGQAIKDQIDQRREDAKEYPAVGHVADTKQRAQSHKSGDELKRVTDRAHKAPKVAKQSRTERTSAQAHSGRPAHRAAGHHKASTG